jgi:hypothetical protein
MNNKRDKIIIYGLLVAILLGALLLFGVGEFLLWVKKNIHKLICGSNLHRLDIAIRQYAADHDERYPTPEKWCDLLLKHTDIAERKFICRKNVREGRCHYALNPNAKPNSPADMVLLFDTKHGWNQFGTAEILTIENHLRMGCNVLYNNGRVRFVKPQNLQKLIWKDDQNQ